MFQARTLKPFQSFISDVLLTDVYIAVCQYYPKSTYSLVYF